MRAPERTKFAKVAQARRVARGGLVADQRHTGGLESPAMALTVSRVLTALAVYSL